MGDFKPSSPNCRDWQYWEWSSPEHAIEGMKSLIRPVADHPRPGMLFRDVLPVFKVPSAVIAIVDLMAAYIDLHHPQLDVIASPEARGFLLGPMIACQMGKPFVPIRKTGKLPGSGKSGSGQFECQEDAFRPGNKVVVIDDVIATGATLVATCGAITAAEADVIGCLCLVELQELNGKQKLAAPLHAFIQY